MESIDYELLNSLMGLAIAFIAIFIIIIILTFVVFLYYYGLKCQRIEDKNFNDRVKYVIKDIDNGRFNKKD